MRPLRRTTYTTTSLSAPLLANSSPELPLKLDDVVVVFAASENFVPYLSVALQSLVDHASAERKYDIVVLTRTMSPASMITLTQQVTRDHIHIGFLDVDAALGSIQLPHHGHFRPETYFRLLAPQLLSNVDKAVYLDSDLVICDDIAQLFDHDVSNYLLGATQDADTVGQIMGYDENVGPYLKHELDLDDPLQYFQAGVILMNLKRFRETTTPEDLLDLCCERMWRWLDQDVLNKLANGHYLRIDMRWNCLVDWQNLRATHIVSQAPAEIQEQYAQARKNPAIVHFAGPDNRPWLYPDADQADRFWMYARRSPYLDELRSQLEESYASFKGLRKRAQVFALYKGFFPAFDKLFPARSKRRALVIKGFMKAGGDRL